ncbi:glycosyltransferase 87 family protein, partial [Nocardia cyriacigeorgica]|uniref:glycosyltransferase 87 family protein n=1 Tax=Nocardia cyriacigeorgica TaxID=135487 RepID=UPI0024568D97
DTLLDGCDLYGDLPDTSFGFGMPFIYPPFAALALSPFALLPWSVAVVSYFTVSVAALARRPVAQLPPPPRVGRAPATGRHPPMELPRARWTVRLG